MRIKQALLLLILGLAAWGCDGRSTPSTGATDASMRIVSLAPALTQMIADMGELNRVVAVAQNDPVAPPGTPIVGNFNAVDYESLLRVRPTHVVTMMGKEGVPSRLRELADAGRFKLYACPMPTSIGDVLKILTDLEAANDLGRTLNIPNRADDLMLRIGRQFKAVGDAVDGLDRPRVLMVIATEPTIMASGPGTINDDLLRHAGGTNAAFDAMVTAPTYDRESLLLLKPDVIVLMLPGRAPLTDNDPRLAVFHDVPVPAVIHKRFVLLNDPLVQLPSTSMIRTLRQLAQATHPDLKLPPDE